MNEVPEVKIRRRSGLDKVGFIVSSACALHCAALPLVLTLLPLAGLEWFASPWVERIVICISILIGLYSLLPAFRRHHGKYVPLILFLSGFLFLALSRLNALESIEAFMMFLGGMGIATAHYVNWKLMKQFHLCRVQQNCNL